MPRFKYAATTGTGKKISGVITATTFDDAKRDLIKLGYNGIALEPAGNSVGSAAGKRTFSFEAVNPQGKKVLGTIATADEATAREKLLDRHGLRVIKLTDTTPDNPLENSQRETISAEARMVIEKAEQVLETISVYDPDYNALFDAKEEVRYLLKTADLEHVGEKTAALLVLLQGKEKTQVLQEKEEVKTVVQQETGDKISSIRLETEETSKESHNFYFNAVLQEIKPLSLWLLLFYALYFVAAGTVLSKNISVPGQEFWRNSLASPLLFKITLAVLWIHLFCRIKLAFFEKKFLSGMLLGVVILLLVFWTFLV